MGEREKAMDDQHGKPQIMSEKKLIKLYEEHNDAIYRYAYRYLSHEDLAEECVSDVFMRFLQKVRNGSFPNGNTKAYLYRIAHNWIVDYYRQRKPEEVADPNNLIDPSPNPEIDLSRSERREQLKKALLSLPEEQRIVVDLHIMENWSHEKVANFLGKTVEASRALQYRALQNLRNTIERQWM